MQSSFEQFVLLDNTEFLFNLLFFAFKQLWSHLTEYIRIKELFDPFNPYIVYCKGDPLAEIFGVEKFNRHEALYVLLFFSFFFSRMV